MSKIQITPAWKDVKPSGFYVYIHRRATDGSVFYVGKGSLRRAWDRSPRSDWWLSVAKKNGVIVEIVQSGMSEACSLTMERIYINKHRHVGDKIVNATDGGEGASGYFPHWARSVCCSNGMRFPSLRHARDWLRSNGFPNAHHTGINKCCQGKLDRSHGFTWWYEGDEPKPFKCNRKYWAAPVLCSNGMSFPSISCAVLWLRDNGHPKAVTSNIVSCCKGRYMQAYGYVWSYDELK